MSYLFEAVDVRLQGMVDLVYFVATFLFFFHGAIRPNSPNFKNGPIWTLPKNIEITRKERQHVTFIESHQMSVMTTHVGRQRKKNVGRQRKKKKKMWDGRDHVHVSGLWPHPHRSGFLVTICIDEILPLL